MLIPLPFPQILEGPWFVDWDYLLPPNLEVEPRASRAVSLRLQDFLRRDGVLRQIMPPEEILEEMGGDRSPLV